eukprot:gene12998-biopygen11210
MSSTRRHHVSCCGTSGDCAQTVSRVVSVSRCLRTRSPGAAAESRPAAAGGRPRGSVAECDRQTAPRSVTCAQLGRCARRPRVPRLHRLNSWALPNPLSRPDQLKKFKRFK